MNGDADGGRWHRTVWMEAVWSSPDLRPLERLVAAVYADHARNKRSAWVSLKRVASRTHLSEPAVHRARTALVAAGWLVQQGERSRREAAVYLLAIPASTNGARALSTNGAQALSTNSPSPSTNAPLPEYQPSVTPPQVLPQNSPHQGDEMTDRAEATDEALAAFGASHPGREREALHAALALYEQRHGHPCTKPASYFAAWTVEQLQQQIQLPAPKRPQCPDCSPGDPWLYDDAGNMLAKCDHRNRPAA